MPVARDRAVRVQGEATAAQALVDVFRQQTEVVVGRRVFRVVVGESVVLVGDEVELAARGAAEGKPGVADRWPAAPTVREPTLFVDVGNEAVAARRPLDGDAIIASCEESVGDALEVHLIRPLRVV